MIKYFHELTQKEYKELIARKLTYGDLARDYPQPEWCWVSNNGATDGEFGCMSLMAFLVTGEDFCKDHNCDYYKRRDLLRGLTLTEVIQRYPEEVIKLLQAYKDGTYKSPVDTQPSVDCRHCPVRENGCHMVCGEEECLDTLKRMSEQVIRMGVH